MNDKDQDLASYTLWLMDDQCKGILQMTDEQIAAMLQISRPSLYIRRKDPSKFTIGDMERLEEHLRLVKAMLLTTEAGLLNELDTTEEVK